MTLIDGTYDVIVVDAVDRGDDVIAIDVAVASGVMRGDVVTVIARNLGMSEFDLLASPATLIIEDGQPRLTFD